ncbi:ATP-binding protein [Clostridium oryzae]|uniref:DNA replication protein DnaC n=1 Tax=Clostridium oryzae TaxID=1450648 RepID=A0A1V4IQV1_9CLOT|nr:ATP-binding protein [Clostridium oryzae]OPJ62283.1 DNA replication protein DnaC [Clostridium oryzae]
MINSYHESIMRIYENIRNDEKTALEKRKEEIQQKVPEVIAIDNNIRKLCLELAISSMKQVENRDELLKQLRNKITDMRVKKSELLVANGYTQDYLNLRYKCPACKDTGYIGSSKCSCYRQKLVKLYYKNSELSEMLMDNNFDNFNIEFYSTRRAGEEPESPRRNMEKIVSKSINFIKNFSSSSENLLFYGSSGTGKTFLSHCIAKDLLDKGFFVVYRTAEELMQNLRSIRFENNDAIQDLLVSCDLLIIDDLGTEQISEFSKTELFNILNKRLLKKSKILVSTNYSLKELLSIYSERITSRLFGNFSLCKFYGDDIRVTKNMHSIKP